MFSQFKNKFYLGRPSKDSAFKIYEGAWKYEFEKMSVDEIWKILDKDPRPGWCAQIYGDLSGKKLLELGPADGYNTAQLERLGAIVTAVEGNVDAFNRCLILKNALDLKSTFYLGDFLQTLNEEVSYDIIYASGVLYHLIDPIDFLEMCVSKCPRLYIWTHYYDEEHVELVNYEKKAFSKRISVKKNYKGQVFTYWQKTYDVSHVDLLGYIGGMNDRAHWMTHDDLFRSINAVGYDIVRSIENKGDASIMPSVNLFLNRR
jgi:protein-L-isoaspartate O-methyltransferase